MSLVSSDGGGHVAGLWVRFGEVDGETVIFASGEFDLTTAERMSRALELGSSLGGNRLMIDVTDLAFIDVAGLRLLASHHHRLVRQERAGIVIRGAARAVRRAFEIAGFAFLLEDSPVGLVQVPAAPAPGRDLDAARRIAGLSLRSMFAAYVALGGTAGLDEMAAYLGGGAEILDDHQRDVAAHAVNERLADLGRTECLLPYTADQRGARKARP